jgi:hypothetical protein
MAAGPELEPRESLRNLDEHTAASTNEGSFGGLRIGGPGQTGGALVSVQQPPHGTSDVPPPRSPPELELVDQQARRPKSEEKTEERKAAESASKEVVAPSREETDDSSLLVSKSWYIQGGTGNRKEAARISKVLKAFRWKVEPLYTIGVILDDLLSVETSKNQISRALITSIEGTGYRLTAVSVDQGKPVAWFKKAAPAPKESEGDVPGASSLDEVGAELEAGVAG